MITPGDEGSLRADIKEGIQYALFLGKEEGRFTEEEIRIDDIRLNKLQYIVNEERDLGLTFGWFKYGPAVEDPTVDSGYILEPRSKDQISHLEESRLPSQDYMTSEAFAYYFIKDLGEEFDRIVTARETKEYLEEFYEKYCPEDEYAARFTDLYIASARLQQTLDKIGSGREWFGNSTEYYYEVDRRFTPVIEEILSNESIEHTAEPVEKYRRILTSILSEADAQAEISPSQQSFINNAIRKFYSTIWDFVAQEISLETMRGENVDDLRPDVEATVEKYQDGSWKHELESIEDRRSSVGLQRDIEDMGHLQGDESEDEDQTVDEEVIERLTQAGAEVIIE